jgi:hypothetical protein
MVVAGIVSHRLGEELPRGLLSIAGPIHTQKCYLGKDPSSRDRLDAFQVPSGRFRHSTLTVGPLRSVIRSD